MVQAPHGHALLTDLVADLPGEQAEDVRGFTARVGTAAPVRWLDVQVAVGGAVDVNAALTHVVAREVLAAVDDLDLSLPRTVAGPTATRRARRSVHGVRWGRSGAAGDGLALRLDWTGR